MNKQRHAEQAVRDAERSVLGSMLFLNEAIDRVDLRSEHFRWDHHRIIFEAITAMRRRGSDTIDLVTLADELSKRSLLTEIGGPPEIVLIAETVPNAAHALHYANIVKSAWLQREVSKLCKRTLTDALESDPETLLASLQTGVATLAGDAVGADGYADATTIMNEILDARDNPVPRIKTGLSRLDWLLNGGFGPGELIILAARTSVGKTAMACQFAATAIGKHSVYFASVEMDRTKIGGRILRAMPGDEVLAQNRFAAANLHIDSNSHTLDRIVRQTRRQVHKHGPGLVIVDYLQLINHGNQRTPRHERVGDVSRQLKLLAGELSVPIVALAQVNREASKANAAPQLHDLRDSGAIEQDADVVMFLHNPDPNDHAEEAAIELHVRKNREGRVGNRKLVFDRPHGTFRERIYEPA